jgi:CSLREA domain-containing protein
VARIHVDVHGIASLGALQASLRYDHTALEISRIVLPPHFDSGGATRLVQTNEAVDRTTFGAWSCPAAECSGRIATARASANAASASASQRVAEIDVEPLAAGHVELRLDGGLLADTAGHVLARNATASFTLHVDGGTHAYPAPRGAVAATPHAAHAATAAALDIDGDHTVSPRDPMALEPAWDVATEASDSCATPPPGTDVDGDGCLSVADIQSVAGHVNAPDASARTATSTSPYGASPYGVVPNASTFVVNSTADAPDASANGVCATAGGDCTLRAALQEANRAGTAATVDFNIPGAGIHTIHFTSAPPAFTNPAGITIDGFSQPGSRANTDPLVVNAVYGIEIEGNGPHSFNGFTVTSSNNVFKGFVMHGFVKEMFFTGTTANNNQVIGDIIGLQPDGSFDPGYGYAVASSCIVFQAGASHNQFGEPGVANRNVISGCNHIGITSYNWGTKFDNVQNDIIGLDPTGTQNRKSLGHGVDVNEGVQNELVGGTAPGDGNVLSGNRDEGIEISHNSLTENNSIVDNFIGTDATGNAAPDYAHNGKWGIHLEGYPDCTLTANKQCPEDAGTNFVSGNVVAGSGHGGIVVDKGVHDSIIQDNLVGILPNGQPAGNTLYGIHLEAGSVRNTVGPGNIVAYNDSGVSLRPDALSPPDPVPTKTNANKITQNSIFSNSVNGLESLGIDLTPQGKVNTAQDCDPNVNDCMIAPTLTNPTPSSVDAVTCAGCTVEVFLSDQPQGSVGSGKTYLGNAIADGTGVAHLALPAGTAGQIITADSTNANNSTSEFSRNIKVPSSGGVTNQFPTASFTWSCNLQDCAMNGAGSNDPDGSIAAYNWNFGDGATAQGVTVSHHFATASVFTVSLVVTDNLGGTGAVSVPVDASKVGTQGNSVFAIGNQHPVNGTYTPIPGDFNGDGKADILWYGKGTNGDVLWYATSHGFVNGPSITINGVYVPLAGDFNGDGKTDIFWYSPGNGGESVWYGATSGFTGGGHFTVNGSYKPAVGDFNGDGKADIVWNTRVTPTQAIWYGTTNGFAQHTANVAGAHGTALVGDFNGDGSDDVLWYQPGTARDALWLGTPFGLAVASTHPKINGSYVPVTGDFNGDGKADVLWYAPGGAADTVWYGSTNGIAAGPHVAINGVYLPIAGDYNGDGKTDVFWYAAGPAADSIWLGL